MLKHHQKGQSQETIFNPRFRIALFKVMIVLAMGSVVLRLFWLQVVSRGFYTKLAEQQHGASFTLLPKRGMIYVKDPKSVNKVFPVAVNKTVYGIFVNGRDVEDAKVMAAFLAPLLALDQTELEEKLSKKDDPYIPIAKNVPEDLVQEMKSSGMKGFGYEPVQLRYYPERHLLSHVLGFVKKDDDGTVRGSYGIEGWWNKELTGVRGYLAMDSDPSGRLIGTGDRVETEAQDGVDITLTIDRAIQFVACEKLRAAVEKHQAESGSVIILNPKTGAIMAMCNVPDFDPNDFSQVTDVGVFNNLAVFTPYEPGSVMKAITMAAAIDAERVTPATTYIDEGFEKIDGFTIRNSDLKAHGEVTIAKILEDSLNTGTIFAVQQLGSILFKEYVEKFGFGKLLGVELSTESEGNTTALEKRGDIWSATGSFGQGITVTPLQMAAAYGAIANGGRLMRPYIVDSLTMPDGRVVKMEPSEIRQVISRKSAGLVGGMLVGVVEDGHGKRAGVKGYYVAGKTGTAQIARKDGRGYEPGVTIGTFVGYAPVDDAAFVMIVKIDKPKDVQFAESSAAPLFGDIASFLLHYLEVPAVR
jgi:cell division protein FtsI/penicillin-binding protein 2